jgi:hypothetical protein
LRLVKRDGEKAHVDATAQVTKPAFKDSLEWIRF